MAADTTGNKNLDSFRTGELCLGAMGIAQKILNKDSEDNKNNIITKRRISAKKKRSRSDGNIEAEIISNCAKILGYTVQ